MPVAMAVTWSTISASRTEKRRPGRDDNVRNQQKFIPFDFAPATWVSDAEQIGNLHAIHSAQTKKLVNTWNAVRVFEFGEPMIGDKKFGIFLHLRDLLALFFHFAHGNPQA